MSQDLDALQRELAELEAQLAAIQHARTEHAQAELAEVEREREEFRLEQVELARKQETILQRARLDPWWFIDSNFGLDGGDY